MMILRSSPASPFVRKVRIAADLLGLSDRIKVVDVDTNEPDSELRRENPLGKIPTLVLADGTTLYDSAVIADFLDDLAGGGRLVPHGPERFRVLTRQALADGIMEAALLQVYEGRYRPEERHEPRWLALQAGKIGRGLDLFAASPPASTGAVDIASVGLACALGYLDLRLGGSWRGTHPGLVAWLDAFAAAVPAFEATRFTG